MSEAIIFENMPYNLFLKQRMEFVVICQDHLAANVMRVVEAEMIKRKEAWQTKAEKALDEKKPQPKEPKAYWVRLSLSQIIARLYMFDSAKLKKPESEDLESAEWKEYRFKKALSISKGTLRKAIDHLKSLGFLIERSKPGDEFGAPIWTLHKENVQKSLKALPQNPFTIFHALGGGSKFEYGGEVQNLNVPPTNFECGDSQNLNVPGSENAPGEVQNLEVDIDSSIDTLLDLEIDNEIEGTYSDPPESTPPPSGASAPTRTQSQDEPYVPDFTADQHTTSQDKSDEQQSTSTPAQDVPRTAEISATAELSTSQASSPQVRAKVAPAQPPRTGRTTRQRGQGKKTTEYRVYFSLEGAAFRGWYEELTGEPIDETAANARACNALAKLASVTRDNLRLVLSAIDTNKWVKANNVAVTLQDLASDDGKLRWEKWLKSARQKKPTVPTREADPYSVAALLEEQNPGYFAEKEALETAWRS